MKCIVAIGTYTVIILAMIYYGYMNMNTDKHNYECKKNRLYKSATPNSYVFLKTSTECFDSREEFETTIKKTK
jgi:hypothetical protein